MRRGVGGLAVVLVLGMYFFLYTAKNAAPAEMTPEQKAVIVAEVDSLTVEWWEAWKAFDWDRGLSFIEDGPETTAWATFLLSRK